MSPTVFANMPGASRISASPAAGAAHMLLQCAASPCFFPSPCAAVSHSSRFLPLISVRQSAVADAQAHIQASYGRNHSLNTVCTIALPMPDKTRLWYRADSTSGLCDASSASAIISPEASAIRADHAAAVSPAALSTSPANIAAKVAGAMRLRRSESNSFHRSMSGSCEAAPNIHAAFCQSPRIQR